MWAGGCGLVAVLGCRHPRSLPSGVPFWRLWRRCRGGGGARHPRRFGRKRCVGAASVIFGGAEKYLGELVERSGLVRRDGCKWCGGRWVLQCENQILCSDNGCIGRRRFGHVKVVRKKLHGASDALLPRSGNVGAMAPVVVGGRADVPPVDTVRGPFLAGAYTNPALPYEA